MSRRLVPLQATNVQVCDIAEELREKVKKFKFRKEKNNAAIVCRYQFIFFQNISLIGAYS